MGFRGAPLFMVVLPGAKSGVSVVRFGSMVARNKITSKILGIQLILLDICVFLLLLKALYFGQNPLLFGLLKSEPL